ncbi:MAG: hypothetical protein KIS78_12825 [Labilithrix sp.]|nr:hypothetical protein [Labilithrix sp.]
MRSALSPVRLLRALFPLVVLLALACVGCAAETLEESASSRSASSEGPAAKQAADELKVAVEKKDATDARLGRALARVSPMITVEQNRAFVNAFQALPDVRAVSADYHARASALDAELRRILARDSELSAVMDGLTLEGTDYIVYGPDQLFEGFALLAQSPSASGALAFAARLLAGDPKLAAVRASDREIVERILVPALPGAYLEQLLASGSNERATSRTKEILRAGGSKLRSVASWLDTHNKLTGNDITADTIQVSGRSVGQALRGVAAVMAIWELGGDLARGDVDAVIQGFVKGGPGAIGGLAQATSLFRRVLLGIDETPLADVIVKYSGNLAKGISFVSTIFSLIENAGQWNEGVAAKVRVAGDLVALGASVLVLLSAGGPAGPVLATVAVGIHLLADWLESRAIAAEERRDLVACLPATGVGAVLVDRMVGSHPALVRILTETVKLSPADLQWFMTVYPEAVAKDSYTPLQYIGVQVAQKIFDLDGAETRAMLAAVVGSETDAQKKTQMLDVFLRGLEYGQGWNGDITRAQALSWLDREATSDTSGRAADRALREAAFRNGRAYLAAR